MDGRPIHPSRLARRDSPSCALPVDQTLQAAAMHSRPVSSSSLSCGPEGRRKNYLPGSTPLRQYLGPFQSNVTCPLQEAAGPTGTPVRVRAPFSMKDVYQIQKDLGKFSEDPERHTEKFQELTQSFDLT